MFRVGCLVERHCHHQNVRDSESAVCSVQFGRVLNLGLPRPGGAGMPTQALSGRMRDKSVGRSAILQIYLSA